MRNKIFGHLRPRVIDRNTRARLMVMAHAAARRTERGKAYGSITAKAVAVFRALLYEFANAGTGRCFPSYERIAEAAVCARSTVAASVKALEAAGLISWANRLVRVRIASRVRVMRTSNGYEFPPIVGMVSSKSDFRTGTQNQVPSLTERREPTPLERAIERMAGLRKGTFEGKDKCSRVE